jgi:integrase
MAENDAGEKRHGRRRALTTAAVERIKPPASGQSEHFDSGFPGLALRISYGGSRSWVYFYRTHGKQRRLTLGAYPALSLAEARERWREARAAVERGDDPAAAKAEAKRREPDTVRSVGEQFVVKYAAPRNRTAGEVARMFERHLYPALGHRRIETVTRRDILDILDDVEERTSGARANRVLANVRRMFSWAVERGILEASPAAGVRAPGQERARDRVLTDAEVRAFLRACDALGEPFGPLLLLLLLTGQRRDEVAALPWAELDLGAALWRLPAERTKNKRASDVPLAEQAVMILKTVTHRSPLVFPAAFSRDGNTEPRPLSGFGRAKTRLDALMLEELRKADAAATLPAWRLHDLRRTAASGMARLGVAVHVVEAILNHKTGAISGVAAVYNRHDYAAEKRAAAQAWANWLDSLIDERSSNVVRLGGRP